MVDLKPNVIIKIDQTIPLKGQSLIDWMKKKTKTCYYRLDYYKNLIITDKTKLKGHVWKMIHYANTNQR